MCIGFVDFAKAFPSVSLCHSCIPSGVSHWTEIARNDYVSISEYARGRANTIRFNRNIPHYNRHSSRGCPEVWGRSLPLRNGSGSYIKQSY